MISCNALLKEIGENVRKYRLSRGVSQEDFAEMVKMHRNHIGLIERGEVNVPIYTLYTIADRLKVSIRDLIPSRS